MIATTARFLAPAVAISLTSFATTSACGEIRSTDVPGQPPGWVFAVVWPCLYLTTGLAWAMAPPGADFIFSTIVALCCLWLLVYSCLRMKRGSAVVLATTVLSVATAMGCWTAGASRWLLLPLLLWTSFATYLNVYDAAVQKE